MDYFLGIPSAVACKINIKSTFSVQPFYEKRISYGRTRSLLNKNKQINFFKVATRIFSFHYFIFKVKTAVCNTENVST